MPTLYVSQTDPITGRTTIELIDSEEHSFQSGPERSLSVKLDSIITRASRYSDSDSAPPHYLLAQLPNSQTACPLFTVIPSEIRQYIFHLALLEQDDVSDPIPLHSDIHRPSIRFPKIFPGIGLLRACKLIYLSTHLLPILTTTHRDWQQFPGPPYTVSVPPGIRARNTRERWALMTKEQKKAVVRIHVSASQYWLERECYPFNPDYRKMRLTGLKPRSFAVTVRWDDWSKLGRSGRDNSGGGDDDGGMRAHVSRYEEKWRAWFSTFGESLEEMVMELETTEEKKDELEREVERLRKWRLGPLGDGGKVWGTDGVEVKREIRKGFTSGVEETPGARAMMQNYYAVTVTWRPLSEEPSL